jgi:hypothetical protein
MNPLRYPAIAGLTLMCVSCARTESTFPVTGAVISKGAPATGALVCFRRKGVDSDKHPECIGIVQGDGSFELSSGPLGSGALAGEYDVFIEWKRGPVAAKGRVQTGRDRLTADTPIETLLDCTPSSTRGRTFCLPSTSRIEWVRLLSEC